MRSCAHRQLAQELAWRSAGPVACEQSNHRAGQGPITSDCSVCCLPAADTGANATSSSSGATSASNPARAPVVRIIPEHDQMRSPPFQALC